jgi:hypothetical protein
MQLRTNQLLRAAMILALGIGHARTLVAEGPNRRGLFPVPDGARVAIELDKTRFFLGEDIRLHFVAENIGHKPFSISMYCDGRGATRALRFKVTVRDQAGIFVPDPDPDQTMWGGLGDRPCLKPGRRYYATLQLYRYARLEKPGTYTIRVFHDLGWKETRERKTPAAEATIQVVMPSPAEAARVVEAMYRLPHSDSVLWGEKTPPWPDFAVFRHPLYLPIFRPRARDGCPHALEAIGNIPSPEATRTLIELLEHKDTNFARSALRTLKERLPEPDLEKYTWREHQRWLVARSWRKQFAPAARKFACRLLQAQDTASLHDGAYVLLCLGEQEDLPMLVCGLNTALAGARKTSLGDDEGRTWELWDAALAMMERGVELPLPLRSPAERVIFAQAIKARPDYRPENWQSTYARLLQDKLPSIRQMALDCLPDTPQNSLRILVPKLLLDPNPAVQTSACWAARTIKSPKVQEPLLTVLVTARDKDLFHAANTVGSEILPRLKRFEILVQRLDEEGMFWECLCYLAALVKDSSNINTLDGGLQASVARACKKAWQQFLKDHAADLAGGQTYHFDDPELPVRELFPNVKFWRDKKPKGK